MKKRINVVLLHRAKRQPSESKAAKEAKQLIAIVPVHGMITPRSCVDTVQTQGYSKVSQEGKDYLVVNDANSSIFKQDQHLIEVTENGP